MKNQQLVLEINNFTDNYYSYRVKAQVAKEKHILSELNKYKTRAAEYKKMIKYLKILKGFKDAMEILEAKIDDDPFLEKYLDIIEKSINKELEKNYE